MGQPLFCLTMPAWLASLRLLVVVPRVKEQLHLGHAVLIAENRSTREALSHHVSPLKVSIWNVSLKLPSMFHWPWPSPKPKGQLNKGKPGHSSAGMNNCEQIIQPFTTILVTLGREGEKKGIQCMIHMKLVKLLNFSISSYVK